MNLLFAALPDFLGGLAAALTLAAGRWSTRALRSRSSQTDDDS
ncbi:hypothetical protein ACFUTV_41195 [Streptomyces sp. NPDC057298]